MWHRRLLKRFGLPALVAAALGYAFWAGSQGNPPEEAPLKPSGDKEIQLEAFDHLRLEAPVDLRLRQGAGHRVRVVADGMAQAKLNLKVEVIDGRRVLRVRGQQGSGGEWLRQLEMLRLDVTVPTLAGLESQSSGDVRLLAWKGDRLEIVLAGSGDLRAEDLHVDELQVRLLGSGDAVLAGATRHLNAELQGSGDLRATSLQTESTRIDLRGSGDAGVTVQAALAVKLSGSGEVRYGGRVEAVSSEVTGSGRLRRRE